MTQVDFIHVQKFLSGVDYPASKEQLVEHAKSKNADEQAMDALRRLPDKEYEGPSGISKELARS
ncbi:DUF2795 domain-containing protein [Sphaerisporangium rhizosphaerae]|uniref:DUF2795 domain-containing protein n=1 Tax=Sphaerisporangium rhizosphaerae TaxID=2269375 RepID=A0ABW2NYD2_9ACTN